MNSNSFSWARMWALTRRNAIENKRRLLMAAGVAFGLILLICILITKSFAPYDYAGSDSRTFGVTMACMWLAVIAAQISGSLTFSSYNSKARRISNLMLPAAQSEKFLANIAIYVVGGNIALILCMLLGDCLSAAMFGIAPAVSHIPFREIFGSAEKFEIALAMSLSGLWLALFAQALYVIGSALWPKYSFAKTFVALLALQIILPILLPMDFLGAASRNFFGLFHGWDIPEATMHVIGWTFMGCLYALLVALYFAAWQIFKRTQVIQRFKMK